MSKLTDDTKLFRISKLTGKSQRRISQYQVCGHSNCRQNKMLMNTKMQGQGKPNYNLTVMGSKLSIPTQERAQGIIMGYSTLYSLMVRKQEVFFKRNTTLEKPALKNPCWSCRIPSHIFYCTLLAELRFVFLGQGDTHAIRRSHPGVLNCLPQWKLRKGFRTWQGHLHSNLGLRDSRSYLLAFWSSGFP